MDEYNKIMAGNRIKNRRIELKMTLAELGNAVGVAPSTIQRYEAGSIDRPKIPVIKAICSVLDISYEWVTGLSDIPSNAFRADNQPGVKVPVIGRVAAGLACHAEEYIEGYETVPVSDINSSDDYVYLRVSGDSMSPMILEGDLVLVRCQDIVDNGTYAVVIIDNEDGVVKKIFMSKGRIELRSENPYYPPRIFEGEECARVRIFGKVVECKRKF
ncbi:MAG: LexA family protein [Huintestinicola sp.]